jgi:CDP-glucose 4,6-dehydratase
LGINKELWKGKRVIVTGHTGFKGSWLSLILHKLGAQVYGISLPAIQPRSLYVDAKIFELLEEEFIQDIREIEKLTKILDQVKPDYIFHLAAQALVQESVVDPIGTIATNILGTSNLVYEALKHANLIGITVATTDKVYENEDESKSFKENDKLGGIDPYSASKAATELVTHALVMSCNPHQIPVSTVRAGNVIGGGDWASNRLIPDIIRAVESKEVLEIRNKNATRPFQHVLDCLFGYLLVAQTHISQTNLQIFDSYNFGPEKSLSVSETIGKFTKIIGDFLQIAEQESEVREHIQLHLDSTKAKIELNWLPSYSTDESVNLAASWYIKYLQGKQARDLMLHDLLGCRGFRDAM